MTTTKTSEDRNVAAYEASWTSAEAHQRGGRPYHHVLVGLGRGDRFQASGEFLPLADARAAVLFALDKRKHRLEGPGGRYRLHIGVQAASVNGGEVLFAGNGGGQFDLAKEPRRPTQVFTEKAHEASSVGGLIASATGAPNPVLRAPFGGTLRIVDHPGSHEDIMIDDTVVWQFRHQAIPARRMQVLDGRRVQAGDPIAELVGDCRYMEAEPWASGVSKPTRRPTLDRRLGDRLNLDNQGNLIAWAARAWGLMVDGAADEGSLADTSRELMAMIHFPAIEPGERIKQAVLACCRDAEAFAVEPMFDGVWRLDTSDQAVTCVVVKNDDTGLEEEIRVPAASFTASIPEGPVKAGERIGVMLPAGEYTSFEQLELVAGGPEQAAVVVQAFLDAVVVEHAGGVLVPAWVVGGVPDDIDPSRVFLDLRKLPQTEDGIATMIVAMRPEEVDFEFRAGDARFSFAPSGRQFAADRGRKPAALPVTL